MNEGKTQFFKVLKIKNFLLFVISQTVSQFGDKLDYIALIAIVGLFKEKAPFYLSQLAIFFTAPVFFFGPISGVLVDRWNKKKVLVVCDTLRAILAFLIPTVFLTTGNIYLVFVLVFFMFLCSLFYNTAKMAIIPNLVEKPAILAANSATWFVSRMATFLGMAAGGFIIDWPIWQKYFKVEGWRMGFYIDALTFFISAIVISLITIKFIESKQSKPSVEKELPKLIKLSMKQILRELKEAVVLIIKNRRVSFAIASIFLLVVAGGAIYVLAIPTIQHDLNMGTRGVGLLGAVGSIGLILGALLFGITGHRFDMTKVMLGSFICIGAFVFIFPIIKAYWAIILLAFFVGGLVQPIFICQDTIIHHHVSEEVRGRIFGMREWTLNVTFALAAVVIGTLSTILSKKSLFFIFGIFIAAVSTYLWLQVEAIRRRRKDAESSSVS